MSPVGLSPGVGAPPAPVPEPDLAAECLHPAADESVSVAGRTRPQLSQAVPHSLVLDDDEVDPACGRVRSFRLGDIIRIELPELEDLFDIAQHPLGAGPVRHNERAAKLHVEPYGAGMVQVLYDQDAASIFSIPSAQQRPEIGGGEGAALVGIVGSDPLAVSRTRVQGPWLANPGRGLRRTATLGINSRRCNDLLNPSNTPHGPSPAARWTRAWCRRWARSATATTVRWGGCGEQGEGITRGTGVYVLD